jgi:aspartate aminotransferase
MNYLKKNADGDLSPLKVDLGVGIYRNKNGIYQELECVKKVSIFVFCMSHSFQFNPRPIL